MCIGTVAAVDMGMWGLGYLIIQISMNGHLGLGLEPEKGVVQFLVVDVNLAQFGANLFSHLCLQVLLLLLGTHPQTQTEHMHKWSGGTATIKQMVSTEKVSVHACAHMNSCVCMCVHACVHVPVFYMCAQYTYMYVLLVESGTMSRVHV